MIWSRSEATPYELALPEPKAQPTAVSGYGGCPCCGAGPLQAKVVSSVLWRGEKALMVRGVPALVCPACGEDFVSDATASALERIRDTGSLDGNPEARISIPVFDFGRSRDATRGAKRD